MTRLVGRCPALLGISIAVLLSACQTIAPSAPVTPAPQPAGPAEEARPVITPRIAAAAQTLTKMAQLQDRLYRVAAPLLIKNTELCKSHARNLLGFTAKNRYFYPGEYNEAAHLALDMGERMQVTGVLAGSGAARAGLNVGDRLVTAGGKPLPTGQRAVSSAGSVLGALVRNQSTVAFGIERDAKEKQLSVPVTRACSFGIELGNADNVNSYADGQRVMVTRGMISFADDDDELAYVMAKGMAHNALNHASKERNAGTIGSIIENLKSVRPDTSMLIGSGGIKPMPQELDAAADALSLYMLARAGYKIDDASSFWKRLASTHPATVLNGYVANHPSTAYRVAVIDRIVADIKAKKAAGQPLMP
ncbi:M48 family metallopeptidase [Massilia cavernae]|uniref:Peptidase M48 n=1 Tax=Massilia cavernae TaxID=2320864 RepID=A0A418XQ19_9BURK|nr:M48 family metallopeptidase [Massilia cavernae]RJG14521.1 peptidase M48 [Massilia cavernae]